MRRRDFVILLACAIWGRPTTLRAQQKAMPLIGFLSTASPDTITANVAAFREGLSQDGYVEGRNFAIEYRWAEGHYDRLPVLAANLVGRKVDVIVANGPGILAAKNATMTIPIIFFGGGALIDSGAIGNLAQPGSNVTGFSIMSAEPEPKRLDLLSALVPQARVIALLANPTNSYAERMIQQVQGAARAKGIQLHILKASNSSEIDTAFATIVQLQPGALMVGGDPFFISLREQLVALAAHHAVPAIYEWREFAVAGGLISYGTSLTGLWRQVGIYAGKILKGAKPADLPVQQPTKFELVINLKTAKALGLTVPQSILTRADEVIE